MQFLSITYVLRSIIRNGSCVRQTHTYTETKFQITSELFVNETWIDCGYAYYFRKR